MFVQLIDGSYTYGYEAADGSFKIETKTATGEVKGMRKNALCYINPIKMTKTCSHFLPPLSFKENTVISMENV